MAAHPYNRDTPLPVGDCVAGFGGDRRGGPGEDALPSQDLQSLLRAAQEKCVLCSVSLKSLWEIRSSALSTEHFVTTVFVAFFRFTLPKTSLTVSTDELTIIHQPAPPTSLGVLLP